MSYADEAGGDEPPERRGIGMAEDWEIRSGSDCSRLALRASRNKTADLAAMKETKPTDRERKIMKHPSHRGRGFAPLNPQN